MFERRTPDLFVEPSHSTEPHTSNQMAINACPAGGDVLSCLLSVAQREGVPGLYAGLGFRVLYSALFTAVGFTSFEASKALLGVQDNPPPPPPPGAAGEKAKGKR